MQAAFDAAPTLVVRPIVQSPAPTPTDAVMHSAGGKD
jgi:hypothetical protein